MTHYPLKVFFFIIIIHSLPGFFHVFCCCCSVAQLCPTLCDLMGCRMPGVCVLHHLPELAQTHVH